MKKIIAIILVALMAMSLFASCGGDSGSSQPPDEENTEEAVEDQDDDKDSEEEEAEEEDATAEEEDKEDKEDAAANQQMPSELSDDLMAGQILIDGVVITLPCDASELMALGYSFGDKADHILENGYVTSGRMSAENGNSFVTSVYNGSGSAKPFKECRIDDIYINDRTMEEQVVFLPRGITLGASEEEVTAAYGEPTKRSEDSTTGSMTFVHIEYTSPDDFAHNVKLIFSDNVLYEIDVHTREN